MRHGHAPAVPGPRTATTRAYPANDCLIGVEIKGTSVFDQMREAFMIFKGPG